MSSDYERGRADERAAVVAWHRARAAALEKTARWLEQHGADAAEVMAYIDDAGRHISHALFFEEPQARQRGVGK